MQKAECTNVHGNYHILSSLFICFYFFTFQFHSLNHSFNLTGQRVSKSSEIVHNFSPFMH